jgi:hypothetical protein
MAQLMGGSERVNLGGGYALLAPGLRGRAERLDGGPADLRARTDTTTLLAATLASAGMTSVATIEIEAMPTPVAAPVELRLARGEEALLLEVPDLGPEAGQVVLAINESGALTWHFPLEGGHIQPPSVRGAGDKKRFLIRRRVPPVVAPEPARERALWGALGRKLLKVIVYPITDRLLTAPLAHIAEYWEEANRAYRLRQFSPDNYRSKASAAERDRFMLAASDLDRLVAGRALLFVHGTFSTAHGAFHDLPPEFMSELHQRYGGRVFAFDHFTMSHDPERNVRWFVDAIRRLSAKPLDLDIVCHSRGGLVARTLAEGKDAFGIDTDQVRTNRIALVAVPNGGTVLTDPDHMVEMIDRFTTALNAFPPGGVADIFEGLLISVKIIGHGALNALVGLQSMHPQSQFLKKLNRGGQPQERYFAVAADYEPNEPSLRSLLAASAVHLVDKVFEDAENDFVVPERGVYEKNGSECFPIGGNRCLRLPASAGVMHTTMFGHPEVVRRLGEWLR